MYTNEIKFKLMATSQRLMADKRCFPFLLFFAGVHVKLFGVYLSQKKFDNLARPEINGKREVGKTSEFVAFVLYSL